MKNFIKNTALLLVILNLFSFTALAELGKEDAVDTGDSTGVIVPLQKEEEEDKPQDTPADNDDNNNDNNNDDNNNNNSSSGSGGGGGGGSYRPGTKKDNEAEAPKETTQKENNIRTFADIKQDDWFYNDVMYVFTNNIMTGTSESEFSPNTTLNRAMMITILHRIDGDNSVYEKDIFDDVEKNSWYENAVNWGFENKIVSGTGESTFAPMNNLTREQLCVMLYNYTTHIGVKTEFADISSYTDNETVSAWARDAVSWAVQEKIITGKGNSSLAPKDSATRAEAAAVIRRYVEKFRETEEK